MAARIGLGEFRDVPEHGSWSVRIEPPPIELRGSPLRAVR
jgi:hypothetical protein